MPPLNIKLKTNLPEVNQLLKKYADYISYFFETEKRRSMYIETFQNESIGIFETFARFESDFAPYSDELLEKGKLLDINENYFLQIAPPKERFPKDGFVLSYETNKDDFSRVKEILIKFYSPIDKSIKFIDKSPILDIFFPTYESIISFLNPMFIHMSSVFTVFKNKL